jgi:DNA-nicking Smr family endonuclease
MNRKGFSVQDHALWDELKKSYAPLHSRMRPYGVQNLNQGVAAALNFTPQKPEGRAGTSNVNPPPLMPFDRRLAQRLMRGQIEPDARLDLHGETVETARMQLLHFLQAQQHQGNRIVLVITGKGSSNFAKHTLHGHSLFHTPEREGRLRREIPGFLHETQFRVLAIGYQPAHPRHGGGGAIYVGLRRMGK